ncbi:MAG TPA: hypothetical protein VK750_01620 [Cytophagaceae bacterium]|jgi:hypothetical protein|nr:hypothetical protein [Cytophagaceae bacterium]
MKTPTHFFDERGGRFCSIFMLCFFSITLCHAQKELPPGAKSNGMAGTVCAMSDEAHSLQAVATSAFAKEVYLTSNYKNYYLLPDLYTSAFSIVVPYKTLRLGGFAQRFGPDHYKELRTGVSIAHRIGHTALGLRVNWEELAVEGFPTQHAFTGELGGIVALTPKINFGANLYNFTLSSFENHPLPVILKCGLSGQALPDLFLNGEIEKNIYEPLFIKWGAQYTLSPSVQLLVGYRHPANSLHSGFFISHRSIHVGYSLYWIFRFGISQEFMLSYTIKKVRGRP